MLLSSTNGMAPVAASVARPANDRLAEATIAPAADKSAVAKAQNNDQPAANEVEQAVKTLNDFTAMVAQDVRFSMDEESGKTIVKVVDTATQEVLRQFPSVEALSIARSIDKMQGLLIREKA